MNAIFGYVSVAAVLGFYVYSALSSLAPGSMFAGLAPLTLIAAEGAWCLFGVPAAPRLPRYVYRSLLVPTETH